MKSNPSSVGPEMVYTFNFCPDKALVVESQNQIH